AACVHAAAQPCAIGVADTGMAQLGRALGSEAPAHPLRRKRQWNVRRNVTDFSLDAHVMDLDAVVNRLRLDNFALLGQLNWGPAAIAYAARNPQRISSLILWCSNFR